MRHTILITVFVLQNLFNANSQTQPGDSVKTKTPLVLEYSLLDLPFAANASKTFEGKLSTENRNSNGTFANSFKYKSFEQSVQISTGFVQFYQWGVTQIPMFKKKPVLKRTSEIFLSGILDGVFFSFPYLGSGWMHEEAHRCIMVNAYTSSYNPFIFFNKKKDASSNSLASVSYVLDANLAMMKKSSNANFVRLATAGGESQVFAVSNMQKNNFFHDSKNASSFFYMISIVNVQQYIAICANKEESTKETLAQMKNEGSNQNLRDFTGLDFSAWAYDLNHPNEPYAARGINPYGNGYDRYIYGNKLTDEQYAWLKKQSNLAYINFLSPAMFFINRIKLNANTFFNFSGRYYPTSFGNQVGVELLLQTKKYNWYLAPHLNQNKDHSFFGLEAQMFEKPMNVKGQLFLTTARIIAAAQPQNQEFLTNKAAFTFLGGLTVYWHASKRFRPFMSLEAKTNGWVASNAFLDSRTSVKIGLSARFNQN
ncbi:MAG: hypothetical protein IT236_17615 [Bacteroidia bacterium]|nr:hypothetical protein [Bacteroidia bacterium]